MGVASIARVHHPGR